MVRGYSPVWSATQVPHLLRTQLADSLAVPEHLLRVIAPDVGGGFGIKAVIYPEEIAVALLALRLGRPVRWLEDRREHLLSAAHARQQDLLIEAAASRDGRLLGLRFDLVGDVGGDRLPGVGFAMGDVVIGLVAQKYLKVPPLRPSPTQVLVAQFDQTSPAEALRLAAELRAGGLRVEWYPEAAKLDRQLKYADANGVRFAALLGPDELAQGRVTVKDLAARTQTTCARAEIVEVLRKGLESQM